MAMAMIHGDPGDFICGGLLWSDQDTCSKATSIISSHIRRLIVPILPQGRNPITGGQMVNHALDGLIRREVFKVSKRGKKCSLLLNQGRGVGKFAEPLPRKKCILNKNIIFNLIVLGVLKHVLHLVPSTFTITYYKLIVLNTKFKQPLNNIL